MSKTKKNKDLTLAEQAFAQQQEKDLETAKQLVETDAGKIWSEIKDLNIEMFALPNQKVHMHCHPIVVEPSKLYLLTNSSAVLPSLETAIGNAYQIEQVDKFVIISRTQISFLKR